MNILAMGARKAGRTSICHAGHNSKKIGSRMDSKTISVDGHSLGLTMPQIMNVGVSFLIQKMPKIGRNYTDNCHL